MHTAGPSLMFTVSQSPSLLLATIFLILCGPYMPLLSSHSSLPVLATLHPGTTQAFRSMPFSGT